MPGIRITPCEACVTFTSNLFNIVGYSSCSNSTYTFSSVRQSTDNRFDSAIITIITTKKIEADKTFMFTFSTSESPILHTQIAQVTPTSPRERKQGALKRYRTRHYLLPTPPITRASFAYSKASVGINCKHIPPFNALALEVIVLLLMDSPFRGFHRLLRASLFRIALAPTVAAVVDYHHIFLSTPRRTSCLGARAP